MKKRTVTLLVVLAAFLGLTGGALAASNSTISAILNRTIHVTYNGERQTFKDVNGNTVYPISYNGTTYLPVRAVAGLVGLPVSYDSSTSTVVLGKNGEQSLVSRKHSAATKYNWIITDPTALSFAGSDATQTYKNGIEWNQWNGFASYAKDRVMSFDVSGYTTLKFTAASDVLSTVSLYDQNYNVITTFDMKAGDIVSKTVNLNGATKVAFASDCPVSALGTSTPQNGHVFFYEPALS